MTRLLILSYSPIRSDARVRKQVALFRDRYEVTTCGYGEAPEGVSAHIRIPDELISWKLDRRALILRDYARVLRTQKVNAYLARTLERGSWDVVLANDLETVPLALTLGAAGVHADLHEYAPRQKEGVPRWRIFVAPYLRWLARHYLPRVDSSTTVAQGLADQYEREFGVCPGVVTNATPFHDLSPTEVAAPPRLVHSGAALPDRHLEIMIDAVAAARTEPTLDLYLTRNDPAYLDRLREAALAAGGRVVVKDPVPYEELVPTLNQYDVGVFVLPPVSFNYANALPNKLFDFVQARLATVISPSPEMERVVRAHGLGVVTEDFTAASLTVALDALTPDEVAGFKEAANTAAYDLAAERQMQGWADAVDALGERR